MEGKALSTAARNSLSSYLRGSLGAGANPLSAATYALGAVFGHNIVNMNDREVHHLSSIQQEQVHNIAYNTGNVVQASNLNYTFIPNNIIDLFYNVQVYSIKQFIKQFIKKTQKKLYKIIENIDFYVELGQCCLICSRGYYYNCTCTKSIFIKIYRIYERHDDRFIPQIAITNSPKYPIPPEADIWMHNYIKRINERDNTSRTVNIPYIYFPIELNIKILDHIIKNLYKFKKIKMKIGDSWSMHSRTSTDANFYYH